tara:strand:+ start:533 stop:1039 length:507 start_codon:yes stop_codon:yes gene_type:complete
MNKDFFLISLILLFFQFSATQSFEKNLLKKQTISSNFDSNILGNNNIPIKFIQIVNQKSPIGLFTEKDFNMIQGFLSPQYNLLSTDFLPLDFIIYPNPFNNYFYMEFKERIYTNINVEIYTLSGLLLYNKIFLKSNKIRVENLNLSQSVFVIKVKANRKFYSKKIIKK